MSLYVVVMVCAGHISVHDCNTKTARAYQAFVAPPGNIICGAPPTMTVAQSAVAPNETEYIRQRCELRRF